MMRVSPGVIPQVAAWWSCPSVQTTLAACNLRLRFLIVFFDKMKTASEKETLLASDIYCRSQSDRRTSSHDTYVRPSAMGPMVGMCDTNRHHPERVRRLGGRCDAGDEPSCLSDLEGRGRRTAARLSRRPPDQSRT